MNSVILAFAFLSAIAIAACMVLLFSDAIDDALSRVIPEEMSAAWRRFAKFALFTVTFVGGMRLSELGALVATSAVSAGHPPFGAAQSLMEILKSIAGSLVVASGSLLAFFVATLAIYAGIRVYKTHQRAEPASPRGAERAAVGAERHAVARDRPRPEDSGRVQ